MERLKAMKNQLIALVQTQLNDVKQANTHELGEAVDMIKDIAETEYYCSIVKAMEEREEEEELMRKSGSDHYYYTERYMPIPYQRTLKRDMDRPYGKMYYGDEWDWEHDPEHDRSAGTRDSHHLEHVYELPAHDPHEGRSPSRRKSYMESKEMHMPKEQQMHELESYMQELSGDITDMIHDASPEERQMLQQKLNQLASKINV